MYCNNYDDFTNKAYHMDKSLVSTQALLHTVIIAICIHTFTIHVVFLILYLNVILYFTIIFIIIIAVIEPKLCSGEGEGIFYNLNCEIMNHASYK